MHNPPERRTRQKACACVNKRDRAARLLPWPRNKVAICRDELSSAHFGVLVFTIAILRHHQRLFLRSLEISLTTASIGIWKKSNTSYSGPSQASDSLR